LPFRVIDVGEGEDYSSHPFLRISNSRSVGVYTTLSWCWGSTKPLTTTKGTLKARTEKMPMNSLPKTFQDAVVITRSLGIQYLWIDALCIIQDCEEDWKIQSSEMARIYKNSFLTIVPQIRRIAVGDVSYRDLRRQNSLSNPRTGPTK